MISQELFISVCQIGILLFAAESESIIQTVQQVQTFYKKYFLKTRLSQDGQIRNTQKYYNQTLCFLVHIWMMTPKREKQSEKKRWSSPLHAHRSSVPQRYALHPWGRLATWHLAQLRCLVTRACNHHMSSCAAHPPPPFALIPRLLCHSRSILHTWEVCPPSPPLSTFVIWQLTLRQPLCRSTDSLFTHHLSPLVVLYNKDIKPGMKREYSPCWSLTYYAVYVKPQWEHSAWSTGALTEIWSFWI